MRKTSNGTQVQCVLLFHALNSIQCSPTVFISLFGLKKDLDIFLNKALFGTIQLLIWFSSSFHVGIHR